LVTIELIDLSERIIYLQNLAAEQGMNFFPVILSAASKGGYLIVVKQQGNTTRIPLLVE
jgi:hypothetical protein